MLLRIIANIFLCASILFLPWWFSILAVLCMLLFFDAYEVVVWGLFADVLYGAPLPFFFNFVFVFYAPVRTPPTNSIVSQTFFHLLSAVFSVIYM